MEYYIAIKINELETHVSSGKEMCVMPLEMMEHRQEFELTGHTSPSLCSPGGSSLPSPGRPSEFLQAEKVQAKSSS